MAFFRFFFIIQCIVLPVYLFSAEIIQYQNAEGRRIQLLVYGMNSDGSQNQIEIQNGIWLQVPKTASYTNSNTQFASSGIVKLYNKMVLDFRLNLPLAKGKPNLQALLYDLEDAELQGKQARDNMQEDLPNVDFRKFKQLEPLPFKKFDQDLTADYIQLLREYNSGFGAIMRLESWDYATLDSLIFPYWSSIINQKSNEQVLSILIEDKYTEGEYGFQTYLQSLGFQEQLDSKAPQAVDFQLYKIPGSKYSIQFPNTPKVQILNGNSNFITANSIDKKGRIYNVIRYTLPKDKKSAKFESIFRATLKEVVQREKGQILKISQPYNNLTGIQSQDVWIETQDKLQLQMRVFIDKEEVIIMRVQYAPSMALDRLGERFFGSCVLDRNNTKGFSVLWNKAISYWPGFPNVISEGKESHLTYSLNNNEFSYYIHSGQSVGDLLDYMQPFVGYLIQKYKSRIAQEKHANGVYLSTYEAELRSDSGPSISIRAYYSERKLESKTIQSQEANTISAASFFIRE